MALSQQPMHKCRAPTMRHYAAKLVISHLVFSHPTTMLFRIGAGHNCVLLSNATVQCWGDDHYGQSSPLPDLGPVAAVYAGAYHTCVILAASRTAWCFGFNACSQSAIPEDLVNENTTSIATGYSHTCLSLASGAVRCFGDSGWPWPSADPQYNIPNGNCVLAVSAGEWVLAGISSQWVLHKGAGLQQQ